MTKSTLTPEMHFALNWLALGGELWLYHFGRDEEVVLRRGPAVQSIDRATLYELVRLKFIISGSAGRRIMRFRLTELGQQQAVLT